MRQHPIYKQGEDHEIHMDCIRDTVQVAYPSAGVTATDGGDSTETILPRGSADPGEVLF